MKQTYNSILGSILCAAVIAFTPGCQNGHWATGSEATNAALVSAQAQLAGQVAVLATKIAAGSDVKTALVQASGDAIRSLEGVGITAVQPVVSEQLNKWVPKTSEWQGYSHGVANLISTYVANHGNTPSVLQAALEAVAMGLNTF